MGDFMHLKKDNDNEMKITFVSKSTNEAFARVAVAAFVSQLDITIEEMADIKTAVSEAVTNSIVHGYEDTMGSIDIECTLNGRTTEIIVTDKGKGIADIAKAREPLYTTRPEMERSGMGFTVMETFMDEVEVVSELGVGTTVTMRKTMRSASGST